MTPSTHRFPELRVVPLRDLRLHERVDPARVEPLKQALAAESQLKNPPAVLPGGPGEGTFIVLDGATRVEALRSLGMAYALVQIMRPGRDHLELGAWSQVLLGASADDLARVIGRTPGIEFMPEQHGEAAESGTQRRLLGVLALPGRGRWQILSDSADLGCRVEGLTRLMRACGHLARIERTSETDPATLESLHPGMAGWIEVAAFSLQDVLTLSQNGIKLPAGVTRFVLAPRALRVNYPLQRLRQTLTQSDAQQLLDAWCREQVWRRRIRYYAEPTFIFDE